MTKASTTMIALSALLASLAGRPGPAQADVLYTYVSNPTYTGQNGATAVGVTIMLDITDAAVASGSFTLSGYGSVGDASYDGDTSSLISFSTSAGFTATPSGIDGGGFFDIAFTFDSAGTILSDTISYTALDGDASLSGNAAITSGSIGSSSLGCDSDAASGVCSVSGSFTASTTTVVSEPSSMALLLGICLAGVGLQWHSRRRNRVVDPAHGKFTHIPGCF